MGSTDDVVPEDDFGDSPHPQHMATLQIQNLQMEMVHRLLPQEHGRWLHKLQRGTRTQKSEKQPWWPIQESLILPDFR